MINKAYVILGKNKNGQIMSVTENSFSMGYSKERCKVWIKYPREKNFPKLYFNHLREMKDSYQKSFPSYDWDIYRVNSQRCPIKINWARWKTFRGKYYDKYEYRNPMFIVKN